MAPGVPGAAAGEAESAESALTWQAAALATVPFSPVQALYLSFSSTAVDRAVRKSLKTANSSEAAAVARAAHDVLIEYFPASAGTLDARLAESLAGVPDGPAETKGVAIGAEAAAGVIASRVGGGRGDPSAEEALRFCGAMGEVWLSRFRIVERLGWIDRALAAGGPVASPVHEREPADG